MSRTSRKLVAKVLNMFKNFVQIYSPKYFARQSYHVRASVANMSPRNFGKFSMQKFCDTRTGEKIKLRDIRINVVRHSHECLATVLRMKIKLKVHSWELHETLSKCCATVTKYVFKIRPDFTNLSH